MENVSIEAKVYSDGSKAWYLNFWDNEGKKFHALRITSKQFHELKEKKFDVYPNNYNNQKL
jgi:hypothetical protein